MLQHSPGLSPSAKSFVNPAVPSCHITWCHLDWLCLCMMPPAQADVEVSAEGGTSSFLTAQHLCESGMSWGWERAWIALAGRVWVGEVNSVWVVGRLSS